MSGLGVVSSTFVVTDIYGQGYDAAALSNLSGHAMAVDAVVVHGGQPPVRLRANIPANTTSSFFSLFNRSLKNSTVILSTSDASLQLDGR